VREAVVGIGLAAAAVGAATSGSSTVAQSTGPSPSVDASPSPSVVELTIEFADGPFDLPDPAVGLANLTSYVATLSVSFNGTVAGTPVNTTGLATMRVSPRGRDLTLEQGSDGLVTWRADIGGSTYVREGDGPCTARAAVEGESLADLFEPAAQLAPLIGAAEAGQERIDAVPTRRYTFDARSLFAPSATSASGDVWVAESGGHVVRYRLSVDGGPEYFGGEATGTRVHEYQVSVPSKPLAIELPDDCPLQVDAPLLDDATDVVRRPGMLSFASTISVARATQAYTRLLKAAKWKATMPPDVARSTAVMTFRKGKRGLIVIIRGRSGSIEIQVVATQAP
jgi:hypothetical protein